MDKNSETHSHGTKMVCVLMLFTFDISKQKFRYQQEGVSMKIEVASRFEKSNRLYQQGAIGPLFLGGKEGVWAHSAQEILRFQSPKM